MREIKSNNHILSFLENSYDSFKREGASNTRGPFRQSLIHYAAMGDCTELLEILLRNGAAKDSSRPEDEVYIFKLLSVAHWFGGTFSFKSVAKLDSMISFKKKGPWSGRRSDQVARWSPPVLWTKANDSRRRFLE